MGEKVRQAVKQERARHLDCAGEKYSPAWGGKVNWTYLFWPKK
jgi:hypothetical protein